MPQSVQYSDPTSVISVFVYRRWGRGSVGYSGLWNTLVIFLSYFSLETKIFLSAAPTSGVTWAAEMATL